MTQLQASRGVAPARRALVLALAVAIAPSVAAQSAPPASFTTLPGIPGYGPTLPNTGGTALGDTFSSSTIRASGISADGGVVVGTHGYRQGSYQLLRGGTLTVIRAVQTGGGTQAFRWDGAASSGLGHLADATPMPPRACDPRAGCSTNTLESHATGVSADGRVVVGYSLRGCVGFCPNPAEPARAFVWTAAGGPQDLGMLAGSRSMFARGVSGDGRTVVGSALGSASDFYGQQAFAWTAADGLRALRGLADGLAIARAASFDGAWIVGESSARVGTSTVTRATLWGPDGSPTDLGAIGSSPFSFANDVSFDGNVVVGYGFADGGTMAFRWTRDGGMVALGYVAGQAGSLATAVSGDGRVVVGDSGFTPGGLPAGAPFRWTQATGMQSIQQWLSSGGIVIPLETLLLTATDTSYNGNVVIGTYRRIDLASERDNEYSYLARVGDAGSGFIADLASFRAGVAEAGLLSLDGAGLLASTAMATSRRHGGWNAMAQADRRGCGWVSASRTRYGDDGPDADARELGACIDAGPVRVAAGAGRMDVEQPRSFGGRGAFDARYELLGLAMPLGERIEASLTGYRGRFDGRVERRYANGAGVDASTARPEGDFRGAVARLDWADALRRGRWGVSPYVTYAWSRADADAHTETGGGFPVAYAASSVDMREIAAGAIADYQLSEATSLGVGAESSRRRVDTGDGVGARVIGLFDASMPGSEADDVDSHALLRLRHAFGRTFALQAHARAALNNEEDDIEVALQLRAAF